MLERNFSERQINMVDILMYVAVKSKTHHYVNVHVL